MPRRTCPPELRDTALDCPACARHPAAQEAALQASPVPASPDPGASLRNAEGALREVDLKDVGLEAEDRVRHVHSQWGILRPVLRPSEVSAEDVFIDFGSGVGSVLAEAAAFYPFRRVIGVELAPQFSAAAREMLTSGKRRYRCPDIQVHTADVNEFEIPDDVTVVHMFDPSMVRSFRA